MDTQYRDLHAQIMTAVAETEGTPLPNDNTYVLELTEVNPTAPGMQGIEGTPVQAGAADIPTRPGIYLTRTFHKRGDQAIAIFNTCIMDAAGDVRLVPNIRADSRSKHFADDLCVPLADLMDEHDQINNSDLAADHQVRPAFDNAANAITRWPTKHWSGWIAHLLETLRDKTDLATYEEFLEEVQAGIEARLTTGLW